MIFVDPRKKRKNAKNELFARLIYFGVYPNKNLKSNGQEIILKSIKNHELQCFCADFRVQFFYKTQKNCIF